MRALPLLLLLLASCEISTLRVDRTSATVLSPAQSRETVAEDPLAAARDLTQLFTERRFNLTSSREAPDALVLTFRGDRESLTFGGRYQVTSETFGSEFVATLRGLPGGATQIDIVGRPLVNGQQPYVHTIGPTFDYSHVSGADEATVVVGVFSEMALNRRVLPSSVDVAAVTPASPELRASESCLAARHAAFQQADQVHDLAERARILRGAPECTAQ